MTVEERIREAVKERDRLQADSQKLQGRKEAAEVELARVEAEIRAKNLDPATLDAAISKLELALEQELSEFEAALKTARTALTPFM